MKKQLKRFCAGFLGVMLAVTCIFETMVPMQVYADETKDGGAATETVSVWDGSVEAVTPNEEGVYSITSASQLAWIAEQINENGDSFNGKTIQLNTNVDLNGKSWTPIGSGSYSFKGTFDGNYHTISSLKSRMSGDYSGLFGKTGSNAKICNVTIKDGDVASNQYCGTLVAYNDGTIENCKVYNAMVMRTEPNLYGASVLQIRTNDIQRAVDNENMKDYTVGMNVETGNRVANEILTKGSNYAYMGGLVGFNTGNIRDCEVTANVDITSEINSSYSYTNISLGGLVGQNTGNIDGCIVESDVNSTEYVKTFSQLGSWSGGFVGVQERGSITNCEVLNTHITGNSNMQGGFVGLGSGGSIKNCHTKGTSSQKIELSSVGYANCATGGFIGGNHYTTIDQCSAQVSIQSVVADCEFSSYYYHEVGGFAGRIIEYNTTNCYATGNISASSGNLDGGSWNAPQINVGGFAGRADGDRLAQCYSVGRVEETTSSKVTTEEYVGAFAGYAACSIANCYYNTETSNQSTAIEYTGYGVAGGVTGASTEELRKQATYVGFDFADIWSMDGLKNSGYPVLRGTSQGLSVQNLPMNALGIYVIDETNDKALKNATVTIKEVTTGASKQASSNEDGWAQIEDVDYGQYEIEVTTTDGRKHYSRMDFDMQTRLYTAYVGAKKADGIPIITSVQVRRSGTYADALHGLMRFASGGDEETDIYIGVDWNGAEPGTIYLTQGGTDIISSDSSFISKAKIGASLTQAGKTVYVYAKSKAGKNSSSLATQIKIYTPVLSGEALKGEEGSFKLTDGLSVTIPEGKPLAGLEISFDTSRIPIGVEATDKTLKIVVGFCDFANEFKGEGFESKMWSSFKDEIDDIKDNIKKGADSLGKTQKLIQAYSKDKKLQQMKLDSGFEFDMSACGYVEAVKGADGKWVVSEGGIVLEAKGEYSRQIQAYYVIPLYYEIGAGASVTFEGDIINITAGSGFTPKIEGDLTIEPFFELGGGAGVAKVATVGVSGKASLPILIRLHNDYRKVSLKGEAHFKVKALGFVNLDYKIAEGTWTIKEWGTGAKELQQELLPDLPTDKIYDVGAYSKIDYEDNGEGHIWLGTGKYIELNGYQSVEETQAEITPIEEIRVEDVFEESVSGGDVSGGDVSGGDVSGGDVSGGDSSSEKEDEDSSTEILTPIEKLKEGVSDVSAPRLAVIDGKLIALWVDADSTRTALNQYVLVYSIYDEATQTWSVPAAVYADGTSNYDFDIAGNVVVWQKANRTFTESDDLTAVSQACDIWAAVFDGEKFVQATALTQNETYDGLPVVATDGNKTTALWVDGKGSDAFFAGGQPTIYSMDYSAGEWKVGSYSHELAKTILSMDAGYANGNLYVTWAQDEDSNLNTVEDHEVYLNGTRLTENEKVDSKPSIANGNVSWYADGDVALASLQDTANVKMLLADSQAALGTDDYRLLYSPDGKPYALVWGTGNDGSREVVASYYTSSGWGNPVKLTETGKYVQYFDAICDANQNFTIFYHAAELAEDAELMNHYLAYNVVKPGTDLVLEAIDKGLTDFRAGAEIDVFLQVKNEGSVELTNLEVTLDEQKHAIVLEEALLPGQTTCLDVQYVVPSGFAEKDIAVAVVANGVNDTDISNNKATLHMGGSDLKISMIELQVSAENSKTLQVQIDNVGTTDCEDGLLSLSKDSEMSTVYSTMATGSIPAGSSTILRIPIDPESIFEAGTTNVIYAQASSAESETNSSNNTASVVVEVDEKISSIVLEQKELSLPIGTIYSLQAYTTPEARSADLVWTSDRAVVVSVDKDGTIHANRLGKAVITVSSPDGTVSDTCVVEVVKPDFELKINAEYLLLKPTETAQLKVEVPEVLADVDINWVSDDTSVVTISGDGSVTAVGEGSTIVRARLEEYEMEAECRVDVVSEICENPELKVEQSKYDLNLASDEGCCVGVIIKLPTTYEEQAISKELESAKQSYITEARLIDASTGEQSELLEVAKIVDDRYVVIKGTQKAEKNKKINVSVQAKVNGSQWTTAGNIQVTTKYNLPKVQVKNVTLDLFENRIGKAVTVTSNMGIVEAIAIDSAKDKNNPNPEAFRIGEVDGKLYLSDISLKKGSYKLRLLVAVDGFTDPIPVVCKVTVKETAPKVTLSTKQISIMKDSANSFNIMLKSTDKNATISTYMTKEVALATKQQLAGYAEKTQQSYLETAEMMKQIDFDNKTGKVTLSMDPEKDIKAGTLMLSVAFSNTDKTLLLPLNIKVHSGKASVKSGNIKLNTKVSYEENKATFALNTNPVNLPVSKVDFEIYNTATKQYRALNSEIDLLAADYANDSVTVALTGPKQKGTYKLRAILKDAEGEQLAVSNLTVKIVEEEKVKLSKTSVTLNTRALDNDTAVLDVIETTAGLEWDDAVFQVKDGKNWRTLYDSDGAILNYANNQITVKYSGYISNTKKLQVRVYLKNMFTQEYISPLN